MGDPAHYGMGKSIFMLGQQAGFDMTTQAGLDQFMLYYNAQQLLKNDLAPPPIAGLNSLFPLLPPMGMPSSERDKRRKEKKRHRQNRKRKHK